MSTKIIELLIDENDPESGLDGIALVERPAHESNFEYFNAEPSYHVLTQDEQLRALQMFSSFGEEHGTLEKDGWEIVEIKEIEDTHHKFNINLLHNPNAPSEQDTDEVRFRYKYVGPEDEKNREFCAEMMSQRRVFRIEDIDEMSSRNVNPIGPEGYSLYRWRGSFNCRHRWVQLVYTKGGRIIDKSSVTRGVIDEDPVPGPDTRTTSTIEAGNHPTPRTGGSFSVDTSGLEPYVEELPKKDEFESYNDYPESASNNACKVLEWRDKYGDEVKGMTQVGWTRANQLCKKENISEETIARMSAFQRHRKNAEVSPEFKDTPWKDKGYVAFLGWGGESGVQWAENKLESIRNEEFNFHSNFQVFNSEEQRIVVGPAMVPNFKIIRRDPVTNEIYYVYFSEQTIKQIQQKYMKDLLLNQNNIEHQNKFLKGVDVVESWIVEDEEKDKQAFYGMKYPKGTWMISMKVNDDNVVSLVKEGKLNGFSVQGYFIEKVKFKKSDYLIEEIKNIIKNN